ncbi:MAG: CHASE2 domain-containing protein [Alkalinema sp. RU_4_3]|nr:CHASE2 domain-containing protein [Alkalinema sp. RU_4_3]
MYKLRPIILGSLPSLAVIAGLLVLRGVGALQGLEWQAFDQLMRLRPREVADPRIVIIGIDESDLERLGSYPVSDRVLAQTIQAVATHQPAAIGVDIFRTFAVRRGRGNCSRRSIRCLIYLWPIAIGRIGLEQSWQRQSWGQSSRALWIRP